MICNSNKLLIVLLIIINSIINSSLIYASDEIAGLDISANEGSTNLQTSLSRLQGDVILKHLGILVTGDDAEVQAATENQLQLFVVTGAPATFTHNEKGVETVAKANQLIYKPSLELMELQENVSVIQKSATDSLEIKASQLEFRFIAGQLSQLNAIGSPITFIHQLGEEKVNINAEKINWNSDLQVAILLNATILDENTAFSADKIEYNTATGEITASGQGNQRPNYRYIPEQTSVQEKEPTKSNDS